MSKFCIRFVQFIVLVLAFQSIYEEYASAYKSKYLRESTKLSNNVYNNMGPLWLRRNATTRKNISSINADFDYSRNKRRNNLKNTMMEMKLKKATKWLKRQSKVISTSDKHIINLPSFDSGNMPKFIYHEPAGEKILNSMLSKQKYPMLEPIPGQVLYPPTVPLFRPTPSLQQMITTTEQGILQNLNMIPFYAHDAITLRTTDFSHENEIESVPRLSTKFINKRRSRVKQEKNYVAYRSPDKVHWQPTVPNGTYNTICTTALPPPLLGASSFKNHRFDMQTKVVSSTPASHKREDYKLLKIVHMEDSLEKPLRKPAEKLSSRYSVARTNTYTHNYPVFSLGKLLSTVKTMPDIDMKLNEPQISNSDTWFIINSRQV